MKLTVEKTIKEEVAIDLSKPVYRHFLNEIYKKFELVDGEIIVTKHHEGWSNEFQVRGIVDTDYEAILAKKEWKECSQEEFESKLRERLKKYNLI